jgi:hypothetical protein
LTRPTNLGVIDLSGTCITDAGLVHLSGLRYLSRLDLGDTQVTDAGIRELKRALPSLEISR